MTRLECPTPALYVDVDGLIWFNDANGFAEGDAALQAIAACIDTRAQAVGAVTARLGGDDFLVALPRGTRDLARRLAAEIMADVDALGFVHRPSGKFHCPFQALHVSTLVFTLAPEMLLDRGRLLDDLGYALWRAKQAAGRKDRVAGSVDGLLPARPPGEVSDLEPKGH
ncbi:MAG: hypothetical protein JWM80_2136 [Cyanobacteria bacterium RYN_339]|nr:hypothetical protein [Cyanobacteria bacterium RYN_339]